MEQKQLDEIDESYFGEEFIDEDPLEQLGGNALSNTKGDLNDKSDDLAEKTSVDAKDDLKDEAKTKKATTRKTKAAKTSKMKSTKPESAAEQKIPVATKAEVTKEEIIVTPVKQVKEESREKTEAATLAAAKEKIEKQKKAEEKPKAKPIDPWDDEKSGASLFKEISTWKALTGLVVILLVFSIFTQGFHFADDSFGEAEEGILSLQQAEEKVLEFVNTNLLRPPFLATIETSQELAGLYEVTLSVAGQSVESYITKSGELFFPQGFATDDVVELGEEAVSPGEDSFVAEQDVQADDTDDADDAQAEVEEDADVVPNVPDVSESQEPATSGAKTSGAKVSMELSAKRWLFNPHNLAVKQGDVVELLIKPENLEFTFAIPELGVEQEVSGETTISFTANKQGTFDFVCSSCEDWRGMTGTLTVE